MAWRLPIIIILNYKKKFSVKNRVPPQVPLSAKTKVTIYLINYIIT